MVLNRRPRHDSENVDEIISEDDEEVGDSDGSEGEGSSGEEGEEDEQVEERINHCARMRALLDSTNSRFCTFMFPTKITYHEFYDFISFVWF